MNTFYHGDCKLVMNRKNDIPLESVDLIYLDPPFFTGKIQRGGKWRPGAMEITFDDNKTYWGQHQEEMRRKAPLWLNSIPGSGEFKAYLYYMMVRLRLCKRVLKPTGSIYLHCDWRASHYLKMIMDEIFGVANFRNEIVWCYSGGGISANNFPSKHDTIFRYSKSRDWTFNREYKPYKENTQQVGKHSTYVPLGKRSIDLGKGTPVTDWWTDINTATGWNPERVGYPTQKPIALLERIILTSSNEDNIVLDPFCGCGTAIVAASLHNRHWVGIDISLKAYEVSKGRVHQMPLEMRREFAEAIYISRHLAEVKAMSPNEFERWVNQYYGATKARPDKEVDGITKEDIPIQAKTTKNGTDSPDIHTFNSAIRHHPKLQGIDVKEGIFVSQNGFTDRARQIVSEIEESEGITIHLVIPEEMLK